MDVDERIVTLEDTGPTLEVHAPPGRRPDQDRLHHEVDDLGFQRLLHYPADHIGGV